jgi:hypothetical protein
MRDLNEYALPGGTITGAQVASTASDGFAVVPDAGRMIGASCHVTADLTAINQLEVWVNGSDTGSTVVMPSTMTANAGQFCGMSGSVDVVEGDVINLVSDGGTANAVNVYATIVIAR